MIMMTPDFVETVVFLENENSAEERVEPGEGTAANRISGYYMALGQAEPHQTFFRFGGTHFHVLT